MTEGADSGGLAFVSRGGLKLDHALRAFGVDVRGLVCADFGSSTGGFVDCLLRRGAARVFALDTAYGQLAWKLRNDPRVVVLERTNCLHANPSETVDLVTIDAGWTPQRLVLPAALRWIKPGGRIITLIKPHYEAKELGERVPRGGVLDAEVSERIARATAAWIHSPAAALGVRVDGLVKSPISGGKEKSTGNAEWLALVVRI